MDSNLNYRAAGDERRANNIAFPPRISSVRRCCQYGGARSEDSKNDQEAVREIAYKPKAQWERQAWIRFRKALWYVESHSRDDISLEDIANACKVSAFHLTRIFAATMGLSLMRYVRARRMCQAARQLAVGAEDILRVGSTRGTDRTRRSLVRSANTSV